MHLLRWSIFSILLLGSSANAATCSLQPGPAASTSFFWTPPEELTSFAWRIPVAGCSSCGTSGFVTPRTVRFRMRWFKACSAHVTVSIVGSMQGAGCLQPDPTQVLAGPVTQAISSAVNGIVNHSVSIPGEGCVPSTAFVLLQFSGLGACAAQGVSPGLNASTAACSPCTQFVTASNIFPNLSEWCSEVGASNATWMDLDADCCTPVPTIPGTWGKMKSTYR